METTTTRAPGTSPRAMPAAPLPQRPLSAVAELARFASTLTLAAIPPEITERARACLLYGLGIATLCLQETYGRVAEEAIGALEGEPATGGATVWRSGRRLSVGAAAACNTVLMHGRCQEDTFGSAHFGIAVIPLVLALVESGQAEASRMLQAVVAGYETAGALERRMGRKSSASGFRNSPLYGTIAGAAAASNLLGLDVTQTAAALANAAAFTGGTRQALDDGTDEWRYQPGIAARRALEAVFIARAGLRTSNGAIDGPGGFAMAFGRAALETPLNLGLPGSKWTLPEVQFKPYPVCNRNQTPTLLAARLHGQFDAATVRRVCIRINPHVSRGMLNRGPFGAIGETLMSTYFDCAAALAYGTVTRSKLEDFDDPAIHHWLARLDIETDETVPFPSAVADVETTDGTHHAFAEPRTQADYAMPRAEVLALLSRLSAEDGIGDNALHTLDRFAYTQRHTSVTDVLDAFAGLRAARPL